VLDLPRLRNDQLAIVCHPAETKVLSMGRRWGKTVMSGVVVMNVLRQHGRVAWVAPTYKNSRPLWRWAVSVAAPLAQQRLMHIDRAERTISTRRGGELALYSGDNIDSIRGESFHLVVMDEAAKLTEEAWADAIMPTLADYGGSAIMISTPRGRNWFYYEYLRAQADGHAAAAWQAPSHDNPLPNIRRAARLARERVSDATYRQEWLAQFLESGGVFRNVAALSTAAVAPARRAGQYVWGIDWALSRDFTAVCILDAAAGRQVYLDRYNGVDYTLQRQRIIALAGQYPPTVIISEDNAMGRPNNEELRRAGLPVRGFHTGQGSKAQIIEDLAGALERSALLLLNDPTQITELESYEATRTAAGTRYSAPDGMHDDTVMALALAYSAMRHSGAGVLSYAR